MLVGPCGLWNTELAPAPLPPPRSTCSQTWTLSRQSSPQHLPQPPPTLLGLRALLLHPAAPRPTVTTPSPSAKEPAVVAALRLQPPTLPAAVAEAMMGVGAAVLIPRTPSPQPLSPTPSPQQAPNHQAPAIPGTPHAATVGVGQQIRSRTRNPTPATTHLPPRPLLPLQPGPGLEPRVCGQGGSNKGWLQGKEWVGAQVGRWTGGSRRGLWGKPGRPWRTPGSMRLLSWLSKWVGYIYIYMGQGDKRSVGCEWCGLGGSHVGALAGRSDAWQRHAPPLAPSPLSLPLLPPPPQSHVCARASWLSPCAMHLCTQLLSLSCVAPWHFCFFLCMCVVTPRWCTGICDPPGWSSCIATMWSLPQV